MELGVGLYGPCLILISLLGMNPKAAFPIMMGSCAFLMPIGSLKFIRSGRYSLRASARPGHRRRPGGPDRRLHRQEPASLLTCAGWWSWSCSTRRSSMLRSAATEAPRGEPAAIP